MWLCIDGQDGANGHRYYERIRWVVGERGATSYRHSRYEQLDECSIIIEDGHIKGEEFSTTGKTTKAKPKAKAEPKKDVIEEPKVTDDWGEF